MVAFRSRDGGNRGPLPAALDPPRARDAEPFHDQAVPSADDCRRNRARDSPGAQRHRFYFNVTLFDPAPVASFASLGAIFLLFLIGLETDFRTISTRNNNLVASGGVALPLLFGLLAAYILVPAGDVGANGRRFAIALFLGATVPDKRNA